MTIKGILLDIDGTLMTGPDPIPGADTTLSSLIHAGIPFRLISNGTRRSKQNILAKISAIGIPIHPDQIFTPASAVIGHLRTRGITRCNLLVTGDLATDFLSSGIIHDPTSPVVVVGDAGDGFTYRAMNQAFRSLKSGGELLALEKDRFWMDSDGLSLGAGCFVAGLSFASGTEPTVFGKPSRVFFSMALSGWTFRAGEVLMIGDDPESDIGGAKTAGINGALVRTGKSRDYIPDPGSIHPDAVIDSIADLPALLAVWNENHLPGPGEKER